MKGAMLVLVVDFLPSSLIVCCRSFCSESPTITASFSVEAFIFSSRYFNFFSVDLILSFNCAAFAFICEGRFQGDLLQVPELETCRGG